MKISFVLSAVIALCASTVAAQFDSEQCGPTGGNQVCKNNKCCSQYGWCGTTNAYCRVGCNPAFGRCIGVTSSVASTLRTSVVSRASTSSASPSPVSNRNERCGPSNGGISCIGSIYGSCCSQYGWCGITTAHCKTGCQAAFGICSGLTGTSSRVSSSSSSVARSSQSTSRPLSSSSLTIRSVSSSVQSSSRFSGSSSASILPAASISSAMPSHVSASSSTQSLPFNGASTPLSSSSSRSTSVSNPSPPQISSSQSTLAGSSSGISSSSSQVAAPSTSTSAPASAAASPSAGVSASVSVGNNAATTSAASSVVLSGVVFTPSSSANSISATPVSSSVTASPSASETPRIWIPAQNPTIDRSSAARLVPAHVLALYYVERSPGTAAKYDTVTLVGDSKGILLEDIDTIASVTCSGSSVAIAFTDEATANIARAWPAGTLLFTSVAGCGPAEGTERGVYSLSADPARRSLEERQITSIFTILKQVMPVALKAQIGTLISNLLLDAITLPMTASSIASMNSIASVKPVGASSIPAMATTSKTPPIIPPVITPQPSSDSKAGDVFSTPGPASSSGVLISPEKSTSKAPITPPGILPSTASSVAIASSSVVDSTPSPSVLATPTLDSASFMPAKSTNIASSSSFTSTPDSKSPLPTPQLSFTTTSVLPSSLGAGSSSAPSPSPSSSPAVILSDFCLKVATPGATSKGYWITSGLGDSGMFFMDKALGSFGASRFALDSENTLLLTTPRLPRTKVVGYVGTTGRVKFQDVNDGFNPVKCMVRTDIAGFAGQQILKCVGESPGSEDVPPHIYTGFRQQSGNMLFGTDDLTTSTDTGFLVDLGVFTGSDCVPTSPSSSSDTAASTTSSADISSTAVDATPTPSNASSKVVSDGPSSDATLASSIKDLSTSAVLKDSPSTQTPITTPSVSSVDSIISSSPSPSSTPTPSPGIAYSNFCLRVLTPSRNVDFVVKQTAPTATSGSFYLESHKTTTSLSISRFSIDEAGVLYVNTPGTTGTMITRYSNGSGSRFLWSAQSAQLSFNTCTVRTDVDKFIGQKVLKCTGGNLSNYKYTAFTPVVQSSGPDRLHGAIITSVDGSITPADPSTLIELGLFTGDACPAASIV